MMCQARKTSAMIAVGGQDDSEHDEDRPRAEIDDALLDPAVLRDHGASLPTRPDGVRRFLDSGSAGS